MQFTGFIGPAYELHSPNVDAQRCVNLYPELGELGTGKNQEVAHLRQVPGHKLFAAGAGPNRGTHYTAGGRLFVVEGATLYEVSSAGVKTSRGTLLTSAGTVSIAESPLEVILVDGSAGYLFTLATNVFAQIADVDFPNGAASVVFVDGYFIANLPGGQRFYISSLNAGADWDALDFSTKDGAPDNILALAVYLRDLYLVGSRTTEIWINTGNADFPFERRDFIEYGTAAAHTVKLAGGTLIAVSQDKDGSGVVGKVAGLNAVRVSTFAIEHAIRGYGDISAATAWTYEDGGHFFYALNFPGAKTTLVVEVGTGLWHERVYLNNGAEERDRAEHHAFAFNKHLVGDYANGNLYELDNDTYTHNGAAMLRRRTGPHLAQQGRRFIVHSFQVDCEVGVGIAAGQGSDPQMMMRFSRDGAHTWSSEKTASIGKQGEYTKRVIWRRLGAMRGFVPEVSITDPVKVVLISAFLEAEGLGH